MAQEKDYTRWSLKTWAGTLDQLIRAADLCASKIEEARPFPDSYDLDDHSVKARHFLDLRSTCEEVLDALNASEEHT